MNNYELERQLREQRARERYLEQHPFHKDKPDINPLKVIARLSEEYFKADPEAVEFKLTKAELGSEMEIKATATEFLCKKLEADLDFIHNTKLGYLSIDRKSFEDWLGLVRQRQSQEQRARSINEEYPALTEEVKNREEELKRVEGEMAELRSRKEGLEKSIAKIEEQKKGLPEQIKALEEKKAKVKAEAEKLQAEISKAVKEYEDEQKRINDETKAKEQNKIWLFRRPIMPSDMYDDTPAWKLVNEGIRFFVYGLIFHAIWYLLFFHS